MLAVRGGVADDLGLGGLEDPDELAADDLALLLGVGDPGERVEEALLRRRRRSGRRRSRRRSRARPARPRPCAAGRGRRTRRSAGRRWRAARAPRRPRSRRRRTGRRSRGRSPIWARIALDLLLDDVDHGPGRPAAGDVVAGSARAPAGRARCAAPRGATARRRAGGRGPRRRRPGCRRCEASTVKPVGAPRRPSRRGDIQTVCSARHVGEQRAGSVTVDRRAAVLAGAGVGDLAAEAWAISLEAVAHAEDRDAGLEERRRRRAGRPRLVHRGRAAGQDDRLRACVASISATGMVCGTISE